jgi:tRNA nucleotidyltransferase (CCA-adding enzyme)
MEVYLVGGAVRDEQLGLPVKEQDWCVVGATPDELLSEGYRQIGKHFPVFLHPETNEEYALARTERKTAAGYHGFTVHASPDVTLEEDLSRRDLTINAMAKDANGNLIDPFNGMADLQRRILRHVSSSFSEDPVRILRAAKFNARFADLGFVLADETLDLMSKMVCDGEADALQVDRIWQETEAALAGFNPHLYFQTLRHCGALAIIFPEIDVLFGVSQSSKWHSEIDCGLHTLMVLEQSAKLSEDFSVRFAALVHNLGKATTAGKMMASYTGYEHRSIQLIKDMSKRLPIPRNCRELSILVAEYHKHYHCAFELRPSILLKLFNSIDAFRRPDRFQKFLLACEAGAYDRTGFEDSSYPQTAYLEAARNEATLVKAKQITDTNIDGAAIGVAIDKMRIKAIKKMKAKTAI